MNKALFTVLLLAVALARPGTIRAQTGPDTQPETQASDEKPPQPLVQELFIGDVAYPTNKGKLQADFTALSLFDNPWDQDRQTFRLGLEYGITDRLQFGIDIPYVVHNPDTGESEDGIGDITLEMLYGLVPPKGNNPLAVSPVLRASIPTGDKDRGTGQGDVVWNPGVLLAKRLGHAELYSELGGEFSGDGSAFKYSLAAAYDIGKWRPAMEWAGKVSGDTDPMYVVPSLFYAASDALQLGVGVPLGLTEDSADWGVGVKLTYTFGAGK